MPCGGAGERPRIQVMIRVHMYMYMYMLCRDHVAQQCKRQSAVVEVQHQLVVARLKGYSCTLRPSRDESLDVKRIVFGLSSFSLQL